MEQALTDKQERFCREYLIDCNGTQAAIRAGYSEDSARTRASEMLRNVTVQDRIETLKAELNAKLEDRYSVDKDRVLREYARIAFSDIRLLFNEDGTLKDLATLPDDVAATLQQVDVDELFQGSDAGRILIGHTRKVRVYDKLRALDAIAKVMGYYAPAKKEHKVGLGFFDFLKEASKPYVPDDDDDDAD